jgi:hypothetical protein
MRGRVKEGEGEGRVPSALAPSTTTSRGGIRLKCSKKKESEKAVVFSNGTADWRGRLLRVRLFVPWWTMRNAAVVTATTTIFFSFLSLNNGRKESEKTHQRERSEQRSRHA